MSLSFVTPPGLAPGTLADRHPTDRGLTPVLDRVQARLLLASHALGHMLEVLTIYLQDST